MSAFSLRVTSEAFSTYDTGFRIPFGLVGSLLVEHSRIPSGMSLALQGQALVLIGSAAPADCGEWPILVSFFTFNGQPSLVQLPVSGMLTVDSADEVASQGMPSDTLALGEFYYSLAGGPLRKEMRDGF